LISYTDDKYKCFCDPLSPLSHLLIVFLLLYTVVKQINDDNDDDDDELLASVKM